MISPFNFWSIKSIPAKYIFSFFKSLAINFEILFSWFVKLILLTIIAVFSRKYALQKLSTLLLKNNAESKLIQVASRKTDLKPYFPPGYNKTVT